MAFPGLSTASSRSITQPLHQLSDAHSPPSLYLVSHDGNFEGTREVTLICKPIRAFAPSVAAAPFIP
jgi:hypothetical protein